MGCPHNDKSGVDVTDKEREGVERIDVNSTVIGGQGVRIFVLPREGDFFHVHHGNEPVVEILAILVKFLSYSDSNGINMNSYLNDREFFSGSDGDPGDRDVQALRVLLDDYLVW